MTATPLSFVFSAFCAARCMHQSRRPFIAELDLMRWGLAMARKGGVSADRVLNARKLRDFSDWLEDRRSRIAPTRVGWRGARHGVGPAQLPPVCAKFLQP